LNDNYADQLNIKVEKRNGSFETFDENKLAREVSRSGTPFLMIKDIEKSP
jgi:transcriptional repressor NrdR